MTLCVAALACKGKAIVCIADKAVSYGETIVGESDGTKIIPLSSGVVAMISGDEWSYDRILRKLEGNKALGKSLTGTIAFSEKMYQEARKEVIKITILDPNIMDEGKLTSAAIAEKANKYIRDLSDQVTSFDMGKCGILLCGFDETEKAFIVQLGNPGLAYDNTRLGYSVVGSGAEYCIAQLVGWSEWDRDDNLDEAMYHVLDAKIRAETNAFVGSNFDITIVTAQRNETVPKPIKTLLDEAWSENTHSPYWKREKDDIDPPPPDWKEQLRAYTETIMPSDPQTPAEPSL